MELIRGQHNLQPRHRGCVATIGNFDGVHLGHQAVLGQLAEKSAALKLPSVVITFEPQPQEYFAPATAPPRLTRFREKMQALHRYAVDRVLCLRFNQRLAAMPAEEFVRQIIIEGMQVRYLVVGDDFRFGRGRTGNFAMLQAAGSEHGFQVVNMPTLRIQGERVSSTWLRDALAAGDLATATELLGRPYRICGRIAHGDKRGRTIGFPTANIHLHRRSTALTGVYAVEVYGLEAEPLPGVGNIGNRPTVGGKRALLEVHLLNFDQDIYARHVCVDFMRKLRDERRFASFEALREQIACDAMAAQAFFDKTV